MAGYELTIKNAEEEIKLSTKGENGKPEVFSVEFKMNTLDDSTRNRSDSVRGELLITGHITKESRDITKRLANWAMDSSPKTLYRDVAIVVYDGKDCSGEVLRRYEMDTMFIIDYKETFGKTSDDSGEYELFIAQREGNNKKDVFSN